MIYYFSGTGNSRYVANQLAEALGHKVVDMAQPHENVLLSEGEDVGFIFPVYAWGLPQVVEQFIGTLSPPQHKHFVFAVFTCGDDMAYTDVLLKKLLLKRKWHLGAAYSIQMRNTYICLPGFDVDSKEVEENKEFHTEKRLKHIKLSLAQHCSVGDEELTRGAMPWFKSYVLRPLFNKFLISDKRFRVVSAKCVRCGKCVKCCPLQNISFNREQVPQWNGHCTHCLRCYHICPHHAINYGKFTQTKGQVKINA